MIKRISLAVSGHELEDCQDARGQHGGKVDGETEAVAWSAGVHVPVALACAEGIPVGAT